ncbi:MAG TPA: hypothetical protein VNO30_29925 [Kofleriaceae bacterium]|nr:hypothetical protein [Kofleriaceae bacterium]
MAKAASEIPVDRLAAYERLIATQPDVERKGATMPYTSRNGHMFSFLTKTGTLVLRLPTPDREAFLERYGTTLHTAHGKIMQEFVEVPDALLTKLKELQPYFVRSLAYVGALKPKPTTRKPAAKQPQAKRHSTKSSSARSRARDTLNGKVARSKK